MIDGLLKAAVAAKASDVHLVVGAPPALRISGCLTFYGDEALGAADTLLAFRTMATDEQIGRLETAGELDFCYALPCSGRFRIHVFKQQGAISLAVRIVAGRAPTLAELGHPAVIEMLALQPAGLVLVAGATGSGKSTTVAAMIDAINKKHCYHIITLEDPIEFVYTHNKCIIQQRQLHNDIPSFAVGLRAALRQDPDVIMVGEMRDAETMAIALTAAQTGHLVLSTLHTSNAAQSIERIIDVFAPFQQQQIRVQLSLCLQAVIVQQLLPRVQGGRVAALEILIATPAVCSLIREGKTHLLDSVIQTGASAGMQSKDNALYQLYRQGSISYETAASNAVDEVMFKRVYDCR